VIENSNIGSEIILDQILMKVFCKVVNFNCYSSGTASGSTRPGLHSRAGGYIDGLDDCAAALANNIWML
jgi:hypothetical protein